MYTILLLIDFRRILYKDVFEYEKPLLHPDAKSFYFVSPEEQENQNSWKESFRHLVSYFSLMNHVLLSGHYLSE